MTEEELMETLRAWAKAKRAEGYMVGMRDIEKRVGHRIPRRWFARMVSTGYLKREQSPVGGRFAYWFVDNG